MSVIWSWTYFYNLHWNNYLYFKGLFYIWEEMILMALDIYLEVRKRKGAYIFWMKQVPVLWTLFFILHLFWSLQQWDKLTLLHKWKTPPTQQRLKNNKVYECHPDVKLWNIYLQDIKLIFHMTYKQREMNSLPVILTYFMQGGGKCLFFAITSLLIQLWIIYPCQWDI
jgi:hypothetical protein